jgi:ferrous iron transport protein B
VCHEPGPSGRGHRPEARRVALAGNPNVGKSSLFNRLTGSHQHVGNWPGKTVERHWGTCRAGAVPLTLVDLPGTYSLASSSPEEVVAEQVLCSDDVDAVAVVLDSTNLERNLYLAAQVAELGRPLVLVLNMTDVAEADGFRIDGAALGEAFSAPVVRTTGRSGAGVDELIAVLGVLGRTEPEGPTVGPDTRAPGTPLSIDYGEPLESEIAALEDRLARLLPTHHAAPRWLAVQLLEADPVTIDDVMNVEGGAAVVADAARAAQRVLDATGEEPALLVADRRFAWANGLARASVERRTTLRSRTERLDDVLTNRWLGLPIFLALMWLVFGLVTHVAGPFVDWIDGVVNGPVAALAEAGLAAVGLGGTWFEALVVDGVIGGVGSVLVFVPVLAVLYLALGVLEDSGYMARAAFLLDRVMRPIGLTGKSFLPLLLGFGCNVPGVYATRVLDRRRDRIITALLVPFVSCAARLPVYVLLAAVFFPGSQGTVVFSLYVASIVATLLIGGLLDRFVLRGERTDSFILELPPYRRPSAAVLWAYVAQRVRSFLARAGTVIFACALAVWFLLAIPVGGDGSFGQTDMDDSLFAATAEVVAPVLAPAGLDSWQVAGTFVSGFVAKEVMVSTMEQAYGGEATDTEVEEEPAPVDELVDSGEGLLEAIADAARAVPGIVGLDVGGADADEDVDIAAAMRADLEATSDGHATAAAVAFLALVLLYVPCMATVAAIRHELGGRWAAISIVLNLTVAWLVAVALFQVGSTVGTG